MVGTKDNLARGDLDVPKNVQLYAEDYSGRVVRVASTDSGQLYLASGVNVTINSISGQGVIVSGQTVIGIDFAHNEVHEGAAYITSHYYGDADQTSGAVMMCVPPGSGEYHINFGVTADGAGLVELWESADTSGTTGTAVYARNLKRTSTNSSIVLFKHSVNYLSGTGTLLWNSMIGADNNKTKIGGEAKNGMEFIIQSGDYLVIYRPDADNKKATITAEYYEKI